MRAVSIISLGSALLALWAIGCDSPPGNNAGSGGSAPSDTVTPVCGSGDAGEPINSQGGCTPEPITDQAGTLQGQYGSHPFCLGNRQYIMQVNEWNSSATQTLDYGGGSFYFKVTEQDATSPTNSGPTGFPSMFIGANANRTTLGSNMPKLVSSISSVPTTWNWTDNGATEAASSSNIYNAAYDVWFSTNPAGEPSKSCPSGGFLMVWLHKPTAAEPIGGSPAYSGITVAGIPGTWDAWVGPNVGCNVPCISYVRTDTNPGYSMSFDLNLFIRDAVTNRANTITDAMYLTNVFTGFEIWSGGVGLQTTSFCAGVN